MRDPLVAAVAEHAALARRRRLRLARAGGRSGSQVRRALRLRGHATQTIRRWLGAVIASRRHRDNYEIAYLARCCRDAARGLMTHGGEAALRRAVRRGSRAARAAHASRQRAVTAPGRALRLPARGTRAQVDLAAREARGRVSSGRCCRTTRVDRSLASGARVARDPDPLRARSRDPARGGARRRRRGGPGAARVRARLLGITFTIFNDPRARFLRRDVDPLPLPADAVVASRGRQAFAATLPSTLGVTALAAIALVPQPVLAALLGGVCAGLGLGSAVLARPDRSVALRRPEERRGLSQVACRA